MIKVKICGITNKEDAFNAVDLGADALGFVFFKKSSRNIKPFEASKIISSLPPYVSIVGVFVDEEKSKVEETAKICRLDTLQFHGNESFKYCAGFLKRYKIIKTIKAKNFKVLEDIKYYLDLDGILADTYEPSVAGGTGKCFNWDIACEAKKYNIPLILAGGLSCDNIKEAVSKVKPFAVDVSSGVEISPRKKNYDLMKKFIYEAKQVF